MSALDMRKHSSSHSLLLSSTSREPTKTRRVSVWSVIEPRLICARSRSPRGRYVHAETRYAQIVALYGGYALVILDYQ